ncbi:unnamed protein product [Ambrosiozyma monospora]|uniref:Unnamed protein product n=1 Tax=Ambrosiozyma monospora TaxID=43982 RepID=A0A9W6Z3Y4_AMBMO|nr:unnamed protein product [Ambrosiozyma monospora]
MQFSSVLFLASAALAAYSNGTVSTITYDTTVEEVVTAFTTYCPEATKITTNGKTYTVTGATTLTITDCPCTIKSTISTEKVTTCSTGKTVESTSGSVVVPTLSTAEGAAAKAGVAGLAAIAGVAAYLL